MQITTQHKSWLTATEAAALLGVSVRAVHALVADKAIPHYRVGKALRFMPELVDEWRRNGGTATNGGAA